MCEGDSRQTLHSLTSHTVVANPGQDPHQVAHDPHTCMYSCSITSCKNWTSLLTSCKAIHHPRPHPYKLVMAKFVLFTAVECPQHDPLIIYCTMYIHTARHAEHSATGDLAGLLHTPLLMRATLH